VTRRLVLATRNAHKVGELREILADVLADLDLQIVGLADFPEVADVVEDGVTFAENALLKARAVAAATGLPALADDFRSGRRRPRGCSGHFLGAVVGTARR
jgi:XTP/dITP diphosphohydrolase